MRLRAQITIDIDANDFVDAADHQRRIERLVGVIKDEYKQTALLLRERRERGRLRTDVAGALRGLSPPRGRT